MSVLPHELMRKVSTDSADSRKTTSTPRSPERFKELMKVAAIDDAPQERDFFSLLEEEEEKVALTAPFTAAPLASQTMPLAVQGPSSPGFDPQIDALFEKMASSMLILCSTGETATTLYLDQPQFASSLFFGTTITIREFTTAPKVFNVEIASMPAAIAHLQAGMTGLLEAFQNSKFNFSVHRIDTFVQTKDRPVMRKEDQDNEKEENQGDRQ